MSEKLGDYSCRGFDLRIVVIGDQSAGKSSVLKPFPACNYCEGLGWCRAAPMRLRLSNSQETTCKASVEADGVPVGRGL